MKNDIWKIVIIDDSPEDRAEIRRLLLKGSDRRYEFIEAENGAAGVRATLASGPDCVMLDYFLPDMSAGEVLAALADSEGATICPIVVVTGSDDSGHGRAMVRAGAQDFLGKGWMGVQSLTRAVENATERWTMARDLEARASALRFSQQQLQLAVEVSGLGVSRIDYGANTVVLDAIAAEMFGLEAGVPLPRSAIHGTFHPDDADELFGLINRCLDPGGDGCFVAEQRVVHRDGSIRWLSVKKQVVFGDVGGIRVPLTGVLAAVDITARKQTRAQMITMNERLLVASMHQHELTEKAEWLSVQLQTDLTARAVAEEALRESQHFIHSVLYNLFAFVGVMTVDGTLTDANRSSLEAAGVQASEVLGRKFWDCYWWSYSPEIQAQLRDACERAANGEVVRYDVPVRMAGDTRAWIDFQVSPLRDTKGRITHLIPSALEITVRHAAEEALRESEERFRIMADGLPLLIWVHDAQGELHFVNRTYREFFGVTPQQVAGPNWHPLVHPEDLESYASEFSACVRDRRPFHAEVRARRLDGQWRWLESRAHPRFSASGEFLGMVGSSPDITERKAAERELSSHRENLQRAVEQRTGELAESVAKLIASERLAALGTLAAGLGHDIANLTLPIRMRLKMLEAACSTDESRDDFAAIGKSLDHLSNLSAGMRLMAMDPERVQASTSADDLEAWCAETTPVWRAAVPSQIRLECTLPRGLGVNIPRHRLAQAVFNLVQNAGEAMAAQGSGTVRVTAEAATSGAGAPVVKLLVRDDGPGMPPEVMARCFEPYFSTKGRAIATGMGLGMVRGIVESAGGAVAVHSALGQGTTFTLTLPAAVSSSTAEAGEPRTAAVTIKGQREGSLAMMFLEQLAFKTVRHLDSTAPNVAMWVVENPDPSLMRAYLDQHPLGRIVVLEGEMDSAPADEGAQRTRNGADLYDRSERMTVLSPSPSPGDLRDAITRASHAGSGIAPGR